MAARRGPTFLRVMLGKELRKLRENSDLTTDSVATNLGFSRTKLTRVEAGDIPLPKLADLERLMDTYGVTGPDQREQLLKMQRGSLSREPFTAYSHLMPSGMPMFLGMERETIRIRGYENKFVHGLLQEESYARALGMDAKIVEERTTEFVEKGVQTRMDRKHLLTAEDGPEVHIILTENTLRTLVGSPEVMRRQYAEIIRLTELDRVEVQIIPENLHTYRSGWEFTILEFSDLGPVVLTEGQKSVTMWSKETDVAQYQRQFDAMVKAAPGPADTPRFLHDLEQKLWT
jgi:transcriptional regulator with XRE-family HTH domain